MILPMLLAVQDAPPAKMPSDDEIVVIGQRRFIDVDIVAPRRRGQLVLQHCRVIRPSGYPELDAVPCEAARRCAAGLMPSRRKLLACIEKRSNVRVDAILAEWKARR